MQEQSCSAHVFFFCKCAVFAPTEEAFAELPAETLDFLTSDAGTDELVEILKYHVRTVVMPAITVLPGSYPTLLGPPIIVSQSTAGVFLNYESKIMKTDVLANNGIVHLIGKVLQVPPSAAPTITPAIEDTAEPTDVPSMAPALPVGLFGTMMALLAWSFF